jgi:hypothetical protein
MDFLCKVCYTAMKSTGEVPSKLPLSPKKMNWASKNTVQATPFAIFHIPTALPAMAHHPHPSHGSTASHPHLASGCSVANCPKTSVFRSAMACFACSGAKSTCATAFREPGLGMAATAAERCHQQW